MPASMLRTGQHLLIAALFFAVGGNWLVLQSVAWGRMIVEYSQRSSIKEAVSQTFDGAHPCDMCKAISKAHKTEKQKAAQIVIKKIEMTYRVCTLLIIPGSRFQKWTVMDLTADRVSIEPPLQPPRMA